VSISRLDKLSRLAEKEWNAKMPRISSPDLEHVLRLSEDAFAALRGSRILVTGATGFVGSWMLETAAYANAVMDARIDVLALVPPSLDVACEAPHIQELPGVQIVRGDVRTLDAPEFASELADDGSIDGVIHTAIAVDATTIGENPIPTLETAVDGTSRTLAVAKRAGATRFLFLSSGAVYGTPKNGMPAIPETYLGGPDPADPRFVYAEGKRIGEMMCACYTRAYGLETVMARGFAFVGPHLPLDRHFAVGNFIRDALAGGPIVVASDGTPVRSYQYAADMAIWLWALFVRGQSGRAYNVGSSHAVSVGELAELVARLAGNGCVVDVRRQSVAGAPIDQYVPDVRLATETMGLTETIGLEDAITRTIRWHWSRA